ncbi:MAG TPA: leucyl/phenylalanyl-tRNA--protein transferase [Caulobacteraceae bacterium]|nr:leucyl/phenylalanyl-tRNA--protein transferase [Caulobacteraceae bacterium]
MVTAFTLEDLIECYANGIFPMAEARDDERVFLVDPEKRGVLPLDAFHLPSRLARTVRSDRFEVRIDSAFAQVVDACATPRPGREDTWINQSIRAMYLGLFARGMAHSVEAWRDGALVGGLYGVSLGAAFFGESMFSDERDASKVALAHLVARLRAGGYRLLDAQFMTGHLAQFGAVEIPRAEYRRRLAHALQAEGDFFALQPAVAGAGALQAITQAS